MGSYQQFHTGVGGPEVFEKQTFAGRLNAAVSTTDIACGELQILTVLAADCESALFVDGNLFAVGSLQTVVERLGFGFVRPVERHPGQLELLVGSHSIPLVGLQATLAQESAVGGPEVHDFQTAVFGPQLSVPATDEVVLKLQRAVIVSANLGGAAVQGKAHPLFLHSHEHRRRADLGVVLDRCGGLGG